MQDLAAINATSPALLHDSYAYLARLRSEAPVFRDPATGIVSVSTYALVLELNKKPKLFSSMFAHLLTSGGAGALDSEEATIMAAGLPWRDTLLTADPPAHQRYKRIAMKAFSHARVAAMAPAIAAITYGLIDQFGPAQEVEFKSVFADILPSYVIADALGVERDDVPSFHDWLRAGIARLAGTASRTERINAARKEIELQHYSLHQLARRRSDQRDDIVSDQGRHGCESPLAAIASVSSARPGKACQIAGGNGTSCTSTSTGATGQRWSLTKQDHADQHHPRRCAHDRLPDHITARGTTGDEQDRHEDAQHDKGNAWPGRPMGRLARGHYARLGHHVA